MFHRIHAVHPETNFFDKDLHEQSLLLGSEEFASPFSSIVLVLLLAVG